MSDLRTVMAAIEAATYLMRVCAQMVVFLMSDGRAPRIKSGADHRRAGAH